MNMSAVVMFSRERRAATYYDEATGTYRSPTSTAFVYYLAVVNVVVVTFALAGPVAGCLGVRRGDECYLLTMTAFAVIVCGTTLLAAWQCLGKGQPQLSLLLLGAFGANLYAAIASFSLRSKMMPSQVYYVMSA